MNWIKLSDCIPTEKEFKDHDFLFAGKNRKGDMEYCTDINSHIKWDWDPKTKIETYSIKKECSLNDRFGVCNLDITHWMIIELPKKDRREDV